MEDKNLIIDLLSDTHNQHAKFDCPGGDILMHCGDVSGGGSDQEIMNFINWFEQQDYVHRIFIPGNHDWSLERNFFYWKNECSNRGIHLLNDSGVTIEGIKIWGSPVTPWFNSWAYNRSRNEKNITMRYPWIKPHWDAIPTDTEVLLTHGPPMGILDEVLYKNGQPHTPSIHTGCEELLKKIKETQIKLHAFGHIHEGRGFHYEGPVTHVNCSSLSNLYDPADNKPMRVKREICQDGSVAYVL